LFAVACLLALWACHSGAGATSAPVYSYQVVNTYPHDPEAFTQGLEYRNGFLYESTGQNGKSTIRKVAIESGAVVQQTTLPERYFGEGITISRGRVIGLTWTSGTGFVYDLEGFRVLSSFNYPGEGWGLTHTGDVIYMSDGSSKLRVWDAETLAEKARIAVKDGDEAVAQLNELEWVKGEIFANVWQTERIARISPADGRVTGWIDLTGLLTDSERARVDVLNGIAYDAEKDRLFVTGKLWPKLFEIKLVKK
jgi:glutamine cyclotransferase